jgi:hypothetical protein
MSKMDDFLEKVIPSTVRVLENHIDAALKNAKLDTEGHFCYIHSGEFSKTIRDIVAEDYVKKGGWVQVIHRISSENGGKGKFTVFDFYSR